MKKISIVLLVLLLAGCGGTQVTQDTGSQDTAGGSAAEKEPDRGHPVSIQWSSTLLEAKRSRCGWR